jgi:hypothetical protein
MVAFCSHSKNEPVLRSECKNVTVSLIRTQRHIAYNSVVLIRFHYNVPIMNGYKIITPGYDFSELAPMYIIRGVVWSCPYLSKPLRILRKMLSAFHIPIPILQASKDSSSMWGKRNSSVLARSDLPKLFHPVKICCYILTLQFCLLWQTYVCLSIKSTLYTKNHAILCNDTWKIEQGIPDKVHEAFFLLS